MKLILATAAFALAASGAMAADLIVDEVGVVDVPAAAYDWSGVYIGANLGFGALSANQPYSDEYGYWYGTQYYGENDDVAGEGFSAGVGAGANAQFGTFVLGIEGDVNWSNLEASDNYNGYYQISTNWDWYATLRARAGVAIDSLLLYATAGVAAVNTTFGFCYEVGYCGDYEYDQTFTQTQFGVTAGIGAEIAVSEDVSFKGEVLYIGLPEETVLSPYYEDDANFTSSAVIARAGLNWHF